MPLAIATARPPLRPVTNGDGELTFVPETTSLARLLSTELLREGMTAHWVSAARAEMRRSMNGSHATQPATSDLGPMHSVWLTPQERRLAIGGYANRVLLPANHGLVAAARGAISAELTRAYDSFNGQVARLLHSATPPGSDYVITDYQLTQVPRALRALNPAARVAHMSYTGFGRPEDFERVEPEVAIHLLDGLLAADVLGFTSHRWARNFLDCVEAFDADRRQVRVEVIPVLADPGEVGDHARSPVARDFGQRCRAGREFLFARLERLDPVKNAVTGFRAFAELLERRPELSARVRYVACVEATRESVEEYRTYRREVEAAVAEVNRRWPGTAELRIDESRAHVIGLLAECDALIVNPVADGMNLVAQEGVLASENDLALVLSRDTGTADLLAGSPIELADPTRLDETRAAYERVMALSRRERHARLARMRSQLARPRPAVLARLREVLRDS